VENKVQRIETYNHHMSDKIITSTFQVIMIWYCKLMINGKPHIPQGPKNGHTKAPMGQEL
jgi:hypothetical protein